MAKSKSHRKSNPSKSKPQKPKKAKPKPAPAASPQPEAQQNVTVSGDEMTAKRMEAATLIAADYLSDEQIAQKIGVNRGTIWRWRQEPEYVARIDSIRLEMIEKIRRRGIANKDWRIKQLQDHILKLLELREERMANPDLAKISKTGLVVHDVKGVGKGADFQMVDTYSLDVGWSKEFRETMKQAAQESGQWVDKVASTTPDGSEEANSGGVALSPEDQERLIESIVTRLGHSDVGEAGGGPADPGGLALPPS